MKPTTFNRETIKLNIARLKKGGEIFEVVLIPEKIILLKEKKIHDINEAIESQKIFSDAKRGLLASENMIKKIFSTEDINEVIKTIVNEGEIQLTQEYREKVRENKKNRIINIITMNAIDPRTNLPHPRARIESCFEDSKAKVDEFKDAESQVNDVVSALRPILPIKFATKIIKLTIPSKFVGSSMNLVRKFGKINKENWLSDGSWDCEVEIPAGIQNDIFDQLNKLTHGDFSSEIKEKSA